MFPKASFERQGNKPIMPYLNDSQLTNESEKIQTTLGKRTISDNPLSSLSDVTQIFDSNSKPGHKSPDKMFPAASFTRQRPERKNSPSVNEKKESLKPLADVSRNMEPRANPHQPDVMFPEASFKRIKPPKKVASKSDFEKMDSLKPLEDVSKIKYSREVFGMNQPDNMFPEAAFTRIKPEKKLNSPSQKEKQSLKPLDDISKLMHSRGAISPRAPDSMFPEAEFTRIKPEKKPTSPSKTEKMSLKPLSDVSKLMYSKEITDPKPPDTLFPEAKFTRHGDLRLMKESFATNSAISNESSNDSTSLAENLPQVFYSTDGKLAIVLMNANKTSQIESELAKKVAPSLVYSPEIYDSSENVSTFPQVPKQLESKCAADIGTKIDANLMIGHHQLKITGVFQGEKISKENIKKIAVNGHLISF
ncbi:unnamed protein product [Caenorhabditis bovis]|uniref:Uncharacterized protein n=1 Tax=Caenorhabditis bovis TaxID=2654633 RepID=A0A8S1EM49_9PELO|nr:unnamed protein product [Caenorhabditis bovis]